jgi:gliding motility-associated-like protein
LWSTGASTANITVTPVSTTVYTLTVTDDDNCVNSESATITVNALTPGTISASGSNDFCSGDSPSTMTLSGTSGGSGSYTYQWQESSNNSTFSNVGSATSTTYSPGAKTALVYYRCKITDANNSSSIDYSNTLTRNVNAVPTISATVSLNRPIALGGSIAVKGSGASNYNYQFESSGSVDQTYASSSGSNSDSKTYTPQNVTPIIVTVKGKSANGCVGQDTSVVYASALVAGTVTNPNSAICEGTAMPNPITGAVSTGGSKTYTYQWQYSTNNSSWNNISNSNSKDLNYSVVLNVSTYFRRQTTDQGFTIVGNSVLQTVNSEPSSTITTSYTSSTGHMPDGATIVLTAPAGLAGYSWTPISGSNNTLSVNPTVSTTYNVTVTDANGCTNTDSKYISIDNLRPGTLSNQSICDGSSPVQINASNDGGGSGIYTFSWELSTDQNTWSSISGVTTSSYTPTPAPSVTSYYRRTITDHNVTKTSTSTVIVSSNPTVYPDKYAVTIPFGGSTTITVYGANSYSWTDGSSTWSGSQYTASPSVTTTYTVTGTDVNGCEDTTQSVVTVASFTAGDIGSDQTICSGDTPSLLTSVQDATGGSGSITYSWESSPDGTSSWSQIGSANQKTYQPPALSVDKYYRRKATSSSVTVTTSTVVYIKVTQGPTTTVSAIRTRIAKGDTTTLTGAGADSYSWTPTGYVIAASGTTASIKPSATATFTVTGTTTGCSSNATQEITVSELSAGTIASNGSTSICPGVTPSSMSFTAAPSNGSLSYSLQWQISTNNINWTNIPNATANTYAPPNPIATSTWYRCQVNDPGISVKPIGVLKYTNAVQYSVTVPTTLSVVATYDTIPPSGTGNVLSVSGGTTSTFKWYVGSISGTPAATNVSTYTPTNNSSETTFHLQYTDSGCLTSVSKTIYVDALNAGTIGTDQDVCDGATSVNALTSTTGASGGTQGSYSYQWEQSSDQTNWSDISGATNATFTPSFPSGFTQTKYYRRKVTNAGVQAVTSLPVTLSKVIRPTLSITAAAASNSSLSASAPVIPNGATINLNSQASNGNVVSYSWSPSAGLSATNTASVQASPTSTTAYSLNAVTDVGCTQTVQITVTVNELTPGTIEIFDGTAAASSMTICPGEAPPANSTIRPKTSGGTPTGGSGAYTYQWEYSTDQTTWTTITSSDNSSADLSTYSLNSTFDNVTATRYYRRKASNTGVVKASDVVQLNVYNAPNILITSTSDTIPPGGTNNLAASGGGAGTYANYEWHLGSIGASPATGTNYGINGSSGNSQTTQMTYVLRGSDANCSNTFTKTIYIDPIDAGSITGDQNICENSTSASVLSNAVVASGGTQGSYLYQWYKRVGLGGSYATIPGANTASYTPSFSSASDNIFYKRQVTNAGITAFSNEVVLTLVTNPVISVAATGQSGSTISIPIGASIQLNATATGQPISSYAWTPPTALNTTSGASVISTPNSSIVYTVTGTNASSCEATGQITVNATNLNAGTVESSSSSSQNEAICPGAVPSVMQPAGSSVPSGGSGSYTYQWQRSSDNISWTDITALNNTSFSNATYTPNSTYDTLNSPRFYRRKVTDMSVNAYSNAINITINQLPTIVASASKNSVPVGGNVVLSGSGAANANSYTWYKQGSQISTSQNPTVSVPVTSRYVVYGVGSNGCGDSSAVNVAAVALTAGGVGPDQTICAGESAATINSTSLPTGGSGNYTYKWFKTTDLNVAFSEITGATQTSYTPSISTTTYFKRKVTDSDISEETSVVTINVVPKPTVSAIASSRYMPPGGTQTLSASGASTYTWSPTVTGLNPAKSQVSITGAGAGTTTYTAQGTDINGCTGSDTVNIYVRNITTGTIGSNQTLCEGAIPASITGTASSGGSGVFTYQWQKSSDNLAWSDINGEVAQNLVFSSSSTTTTYYRRKTIDQSAEALTNTIIINVNPKPILTIATDSGDSLLCQGNSMILTANGATTYSWTLGSTALGSTQAITVSPTATTTYDVTGTSAQGCVSAPASIPISVTPAPVVLVSTDYSQIPPGATVNLTASGASTYAWSPNTGLSSATNPIITATPTSTTRYVVTGTSASGCSDTISQLIKVIPLDGGTITASKSVCSGDTVGTILEVSSSQGGTGSGFTYEWEKSSDNINWTAITNTNNASVVLSEVITQTTYFRRKSNNLSVSAYSNISTVQAISRPTVVLSSNKSTAPRGGNVTFSGSGAATYDLKLNGSSISTSLPYQTQVFSTATYYLEGTDANGCVDTTGLLITVDPLQPGTIGPDQAFCAGSTFNTIQNLTSPSGGSSVYTYQWESSIDGSNYSVIPNTNSLNYTPGILQVTTYFRRRVTDSDLDTITAVATLTVHSDPQVSATASAKTVPPGASITLNGTGAATYIWSGAQSSNLSSTSGSPVTALINASTTYTVTGTDVNGCQDTGVISITVVPINPGTTDASSTVCVGEVPPQIFSITLASGGSGNFSYEWETSSDGVTWSAISGANGTNFTPVNAANATVFYRRVAVNLGVKEPANAVTVTTLNRPSITGSTNLGTIPPGASAILSAQGVNAQGSYDWSVNASSIASTQTVTVTPSNTTNYILTGTDANNCSNTDTVTVSVVPLDGGVITAFPASLCEGEALDSIVSTSLASGGSGVYAYTWQESTDNTNWTAIPNQFGAKLYYAPLITQTKYFRRITTDNGIEAFSNIASVTMNSNPLVQANSLSGRYLPFGAQVSLEGSQGLVTYSWSPTNVLNSSNTRTTSGTLNSTTIFTLDAIDANGCSGQDTIKIFARTLNPGTIGADQIICANEQPNPFTSITSASGGSETFTYKWQDSVATGNWVDILGAVATGYTPGPVATTKFYRRVVIDNSIEKASNIITITVATNPADVVTSDTTVCQGSDPISLSIMATAAPGHTLNWYSSLTGGVGSAVTPTYTPAAVGTTDYFVSQKNNSNGCESSRKKVIMETAVLPSQPTATTNVNYCLGEANPAALTATPSVGTNVIRWYDSDGITRLLTAPTPNTSDAGNKKYYASEYNSTTGCESSPVEITVIVYQPTATATTTQDVSCFGGSDGQVTGLGSAGLAPYNYTWKNSAGQVIGIQSFAAGLTSDNYVVIVEDARGCQDSAGVTVSEPTQLIISSTKQDPQCYGDNGSITLTATGGTPIYNYSFDNGVTYQTSNTKSLPFGQYRMKVRDSKMCEVTDTANPVALNQTTAIAASLTETSVSCNNGLDGKLLAIASGGSPGLSGYQYQWNDPNLQATDSAVGLSAGSYTVTISDQYGCSRNFTKAVNEPDAVIVSDISSTNLKCFESADGSIEITAQGGNALEYSIDNGVTYLPSSTFPNLTVGSYRVVVQDSLNCLVTYNAVRQITLTQPDRIEVQDIVMDSASCNGYSDAQVQIFATGGSEKKYSINGGNFFNNSGLFTGLSSGYYNAVVTDSNNCIATYNTGVSSSGSIQDPDLLYMSGISVTDLSCNNSSDGEIEVIASGGTNRKYSLDAGANYQSSPIFTGLDAGTYTVTLSDANNCPATYALSRTVTILEPDPVVVDSVIEIQPSCNGASNGSITINASGGNDLSYSIDNGVNTQPGDYFPFLPAGNYQITVSDSKSCLVTYNIPTRAVLLSEPDSVIVQDILAEGITCNDASDGSIEIVAGGGNILEYSINNGATYFPTSIFTGLDKGTYQTKVRDSKSCQVFYEVNRVVILTEPDSLFIDSISSNNVTCKNFNNGNIEIFASGGNAPLQYSITRNKPSTFIQQNYFDLLTPGIYETGINDALSCPAYSRVLRNITITEPDQLKVDAIDKEEVTCNSFDDGIIELSVSGGTISYDYKLTSDTDTINQNQPVFIGLSANTYTISVIDSFACPLTYSPGLSQAVKIDQPDTIIVRQINPTDITCNNFNDGKIEIIATGGNDPLEYSIDFGASYFLANEFNNLVAGVYNINVSDSNNCPVVQTPVSVDSMSTRIINPLPIQASSSVTNNLCKADQLGIIDLVISGGTVDTITDYIVTWTDVNSNIVGYGLPIDSLGAGVYISTIEDNNLCLTSISTTITEPDSLLISSITHKDLKCFRSIDGEINISTNGGTGPLYSIDSGLTYLSSGAFAGLDTGTYFVNVTDVNSCISYPTGMTQIQIMQPDSFYVDSVVIEDVDCFGNNTGAILISANGGNSLSYSIDGGLTIADSAFFDSLYAGSYTVQVVDSAGCQGTNSSNNIVDVLEPSLLQASATTILGTKCEIDTTGGATITPTGGVTPYQIIWETFDSTFTITGLNGFEYLYTVADSNLCLFEGVVKIPTTDADCDSIPDIVEGIDDIDNDGLPNYRDRDSDGDKLPDLIEIDANRDGIPAYGELNLQLYDNCDSLDEYNNFGPLGLVPNFLDPEACDTVLFLPGVFTPNGDGKNDKLVFPGIESYEQTTLTLFNRNGEIVFQKSPYDNSFDGTSSRTVFLNNNRDNYLPTGTYFYTLVIEDLLSEFPEQARMQGYIYIQR